MQLVNSTFMMFVLRQCLHSSIIIHLNTLRVYSCARTKNTRADCLAKHLSNNFCVLWVNKIQLNFLRTQWNCSLSVNATRKRRLANGFPEEQNLWRKNKHKTRVIPGEHSIQSTDAAHCRANTSERARAHSRANTEIRRTGCVGRRLHCTRRRADPPCSGRSAERQRLHIDMHARKNSNSCVGLGQHAL